MSDQAKCALIWGTGSVYDLFVEDDDCDSYISVVHKDLGTKKQKDLCDYQCPSILRGGLARAAARIDC